MPIDWFTVVAQAINFLVLVALLKRFLYGPIVRAMAERQQRIASRLAEADGKRLAAEQREQELARASRELEGRREQILEQANEEAKAKRLEMLERAREEVARKETAWLAELDRKRERLVQDLTERTNENLFLALRNALSDLAGEDLHDRAMQVFLRRLGHLDEQEKVDLERVLAEPEITVTTAFPASPDQERALRAAMAKVGGVSSELRFDTDRSLVGGLEVSAGGRRVSWSFRQAARETENVLRASLESFGGIQHAD